MKKHSLFPTLQSVCDKLVLETAQIPEARQILLLQLSHYFTVKFATQQTPKLIAICTHNSRRSHILQLWLAIAADYYALPTIETFSGGTEATAFNPNAITALNRIGLDIKTDGQNSNPIYSIKWNTEMPPYQAFSKKYSSSPNPIKDFAAIMVCSEADEACPIVLGNDLRLALPYDDPKRFDDTPYTAEKYDETARLIGREILYAFSEIQVL